MKFHNIRFHQQGVGRVYIQNELTVCKAAGRGAAGAAASEAAAADGNLQ